jgi:sporulation protein YlmC with PRC-barrel domain
MQTARPADVVALMRLDLGSPVHCSDGAFGELADVVIDPTTRRVSHLVVQSRNAAEPARLVPVALAHSAAGDADKTIVLDCTGAEVGQLESVTESAYLRLEEFPVEDPDWDVGVEEILAMPYYQAFDSGGAAVLYEDHVQWTYDRIPKGEVEIRRASPVTSSDEHHLGHVDGFVVDEDDQITHLVLEHGHLWGKREVVIPIGAVATVATDAVVLSLSKDEVGRLESRGIHRWRS